MLGRLLALALASPLLVACAPAIDFTRSPAFAAHPCAPGDPLRNAEVLPEVVEGGALLELRAAEEPAASPPRRAFQIQAVSGDGSALLMGDGGKHRLVRERSCVELPEHLVSEVWDNIGFDPDGSRFFAVGHDNDGWHLRVWNVATGELEASASSRGAIVPLPGVGRMIFEVKAGSFRVLDLEGHERGELSGPATLRLGDKPETRLHHPVPLLDADRARSTRDGRVLVFPRGFETRVYDLERRSLVLLEQVSRIEASALAPDDRTFATGGASGHVLLWDVRAAASIPFTLAHGDRVRSLSFSADSQVLASSSDDRTVRLTRVSDGATLAKIDLSRRGETPARAWFIDQGTALMIYTEQGALFRFRVKTGGRPEPPSLIQGDPSMFHRDAVAGVAGVTVDAPVICDPATGEAMIVVHGRGRRPLDRQARPACRTADATLEACPKIEAEAFYQALLARAHLPIGGMECADAPRVGGLIVQGSWQGADAAVRLVVEMMTAWDVSADLAVFVTRSSPPVHDL